MKIEQIIAPKPPKTHYELCLEDGRTVRAYPGTMMDFALHVGMDISEDDICALQEKATLAAAKARAINLLRHRSHSRRELAQKLKELASPAQIETILDWLCEIGLLQEDRYAESLVRQGEAKGWGRRRIEQDLRHRGLSPEVYAPFVEALSDPTDAIDHYIAKHLHSHEKRDIKRISDALARRGHSWSDIADGIRRHHLPDEENEVY